VEARTTSATAAAPARKLVKNKRMALRILGSSWERKDFVVQG